MEGAKRTKGGGEIKSRSSRSLPLSVGSRVRSIVNHAVESKRKKRSAKPIGNGPIVRARNTFLSARPVCVRVNNHRHPGRGSLSPHPLHISYQYIDLLLTHVHFRFPRIDKSSPPFPLTSHYRTRMPSWMPCVVDENRHQKEEEEEGRGEVEKRSRSRETWSELISSLE